MGYLWLFEDVTRERQTANQILYLAERDALTGLYNRHRFQEELTRMLSSGERHRRRVALLFFDIDEFKHVNDTFGHRTGDALLIRVAGEVSAQVRRNEVFARLGGDEFAILAPDISDRKRKRSPSASCVRSRAFPSASRATTCASPAAWAWRSIRTTPRPRRIWWRTPMPPCTRRRKRARTPGACTARTRTDHTPDAGAAQLERAHRGRAGERPAAPALPGRIRLRHAAS